MGLTIVKFRGKAVSYGTLSEGDFFLDEEGELAIKMDDDDCFYLEGDCAFEVSERHAALMVTPVDVEAVVSCRVKG